MDSSTPLMTPLLHPLHEPRLVHHRRLGMALRLLSHHPVLRSPTPSTAQALCRRYRCLIEAVDWFVARITITTLLPALKSP